MVIELKIIKGKYIVRRLMTGSSMYEYEEIRIFEPQQYQQANDFARIVAKMQNAAYANRTFYSKHKDLLTTTEY